MSPNDAASALADFLTERACSAWGGEESDPRSPLFDAGALIPVGEYAYWGLMYGIRLAAAHPEYAAALMGTFPNPDLDAGELVVRFPIGQQQ